MLKRIIEWWTALDILERVHEEAKENPGACSRYPYCEDFCTSCDIELFEEYVK